MVVSLYLPVVFLAGVVGVGAAILAWRHRDRAGARPLFVFLVAASVWAVAEGLALSASSLGGLRFWTRVGLSVSAIIPLAWLVSVVEYTGYEDWLTRRWLGALALEPLAFAALVWTNAGSGVHELVWSDGQRQPVAGASTYVVEYELAFWAHQAYSYVLVAAGGLLLLRLILRTSAPYRNQSTALLGAIAVPMIANALDIFRFVPRAFDLVAVGYVLTGVVLSWATLRSRFLTLSPVTRELGREAVVEDLDDRVIVLDDADRIVDANPAAESLLDAPVTALVGQSIDEVLPDLAAVLAEENAAEDVELEHAGRLRYFDVRVSTLSRAGGAVTGRLVSLRDVTERRQREQRLDVLNRLLRHNLRNELNVVQGNADLALDDVDDPTVRDRLQLISDTVDTITERSDKVGRLTRALELDDLGPMPLQTVVSDAIHGLRRDDVGDSIHVEVPPEACVYGGHVLTVALTELVSNAVEHGGSDPTVRIAVDAEESDQDWLVLVVADDGPGIEPREWKTVVAGRETPLHHTSGVGLWLVNWLVRRLGGNVSFETESSGTTVRLRLPRPSPDDRPSGEPAESGRPNAGAGPSNDSSDRGLDEPPSSQRPQLD